MSIPWPGFSHHQLVQVTSVFATFLSPFALAVLANTTNSLVRHHCHTAEPHQQCCNLSRTYSSESRQKAASEPDLVSEQEAVLQDSCQRIRHCSGVSETVLAPIEYCTCYLSDIEEGGDFLPIRLMESSGSQKPAGDEVQAGSINNCTKPSGHGGSQQVLGKNNSQTTDSNCSAEWNNNLAKTRMVGRIDQAFRLNEQTVGDQDEVPISAKKQLQEGDGRTSAQAYLSDAVPGRHDSVRRSHRSAVNSASGKPVQDGHGSQKKERSNTSKLSPSASLSLTEEMGELDELSDFFLGQRKRSTSHQNSGNLTECQNMIPEYLGSFTRVGSAHKSVKPSDVVIPQTTSLPQLVNSGNPQVISNTHKASRQHSDQEQDNSDTQAVNKTRNLGKCALQYLGHIENTLDNQAATSPSVSTSSTAPACDGDIPKPVRRNSLSRADSTSQSDSSKISQFSQITADSESEKPSSYGTAEGSVAELFSESSQCATVKEQGVGSLLCGQKDSTLKTAFDSIIADLIQFQQNQCRDKIEKRPDTPLDKSPKNVKFSPSSTQKTDSMTNVSSLGDISPPLHGLVPSDSSSNEDCLKDVNVTEAFDQLDKIVDELLHLMESRPEPCVK
ncbi:hypothetical protein ACOMHN_031664 [Nucella lapillus]